MTRNNALYIILIAMCLANILFCSCQKEEEIKEPVDYRDKWVGEYEHFDQNGIRNGSIFITKVYDYDSRIWVKGMGVNMATYIDRMGNFTYSNELQGCIYDDTLSILHWKLYGIPDRRLVLDAQCIKKKE